VIKSPSTAVVFLYGAIENPYRAQFTSSYGIRYCRRPPSPKLACATTSAISQSQSRFVCVECGHEGEEYLSGQDGVGGGPCPPLPWIHSTFSAKEAGKTDLKALTAACARRLASCPSLNSTRFGMPRMSRISTASDFDGNRSRIIETRKPRSQAAEQGRKGTEPAFAG
jgi:hypothetical protein